LFSLFSLGGGYLALKSRTLAEKQRVRANGDYHVTVDRSGTSSYFVDQHHQFIHHLVAMRFKDIASFPRKSGSKSRHVALKEIVNGADEDWQVAASEQLHRYNVMEHYLPKRHTNDIPYNYERFSSTSHFLRALTAFWTCFCLQQA
jgi:hypothetical protein